ncbi:MAG: TatD family hydrolase [Lentisphaeria bacterium]|nr:TatD family hydrolase [Lentisphaeria bacterium]
MLPLYDAHAHLADSRLQDSLSEILQDCRLHGIRGILANAAHLSEWQTIAKLADNLDIHPAFGLHPFFIDEWSDDCPAKLEQILLDNPSASVGEIGLDAWSSRDNLPRQVEILAAQLVVAQKHHRFVSLHNRKTWSDFFELLKQLRITELHGICHHFTGSAEIARKLLDLGLYLSFCGPITYPNARRIHAAATFAPQDRILTETDCPDLPPLPVQGQLSRPWHVQYVLETLAELRHVSISCLAGQIEQNWHSLFSNSIYKVL